MLYYITYITGYLFVCLHSLLFWFVVQMVLYFDKGCTIHLWNWYWFYWAYHLWLIEEMTWIKQDRFHLPQRHLGFDQPIRIHLRLMLNSSGVMLGTSPLERVPLFSCLRESWWVFNEIKGYEMSSSTEDDAYEIEFYISWQRPS